MDGHGQIPPPLREVKNLILTAGELKGIAYLGMFSYFEENNIVPQSISGSSAGAFFSLLYLIGFSGAEFASLCGQLEIHHIFDPLEGSKNSICNGLLLLHLLKQIICVKMGTDRLTFAELYDRGKHRVEFSVAVSAFKTGQAEYFGTIESPNVAVIDVIMASVSVPVIFPPVKIGTQFFFDGAVTANVPLKSIEDHPEKNASTTLCIVLSQPIEEITDEQTSSASIIDVLKRVYDLIHNGMLSADKKVLEAKFKNIQVYEWSPSISIRTFISKSSPAEYCQLANELVQYGYRWCVEYESRRTTTSQRI